jgi:hypothetical protein
VYEEITGYWRRMARGRTRWLKDSWIDHGLVVLPRAGALLATGDLVTKSEAISRLAGFGVPESLIQEIRSRRNGHPVSLGKPRGYSRALLTRRIMRDGIARLSRLHPGGPR